MQGGRRDQICDRSCNRKANLVGLVRDARIQNEEYSLPQETTVLIVVVDERLDKNFLTVEKIDKLNLAKFLRR
jgi:hypothetical protein